MMKDREAYEVRLAQLEQELAALRARDQQLTDFVENAAVGLHWLGPDGTILWANQAELDLLGYTKEEYIGHRIAEFHADAGAIEDKLRRLKAGETLRDYEARLRAKDGSILHMLISSSVLWDGDRFVHTRSVTRDITLRKRGAEELRKANESLKALAESAWTRAELLRIALQDSPVVVFHQNADLRYRWVYNPFVEHAHIELMDKLDSELFPAEEASQLTELKQGVLASGRRARREVALTTQGQLRIMDITIEPFRDSSGKLAGVLGIAVDVTDRKRNEERLRESRDALRRFAARFQAAWEKERALTSREVHDIGQILTALDLQLGVLAGRRVSPDAIAEPLKAVSGLLAETIEVSARISRELRPSVLDNLGLAATLDWYAREFACRTGIAVTAEILEEAPVDPDVGTAIFRILQHGLANIERHARATEVRLSFSQVGPCLVLRIRDNGQGISDSTVRDPRSAGLLEMRQLAQLFGATLNICGTPGQGTTICLEVPPDARVSEVEPAGE